MPREPVTYRLAIEHLNERFPDKELFTATDIANMNHLSIRTTRNEYPFKGKYISKVNLFSLPLCFIVPLTKYFTKQCVYSCSCMEMQGKRGSVRYFVLIIVHIPCFHFVKLRFLLLPVLFSFVDPLFKDKCVQNEKHKKGRIIKSNQA